VGGWCFSLVSGMSTTQDSRSLGQHQSIRGPTEFFSFLSTESGLQALSTVENDYDTDIRVENEEILVHPSQLLPDVDRELKNQWHEFEFYRSMRLKLLSERSQSWVLHFPIPKAAMIHFNRPMIIRDARLIDLVVERTGEIIAFGCVDALSMAREIIDNISQANSYPSNSYTGGQYKDSNTVEGSDSNANVAADNAYQVPPAAAYATPDRFEGGAEASNSAASLTPSEGRGAKKEKMIFMVKSTDAPRLIGSRGINKRRIEEMTQCNITLHTETKKDGEFPVEISGWTMEKCAAARDHIKTFLTEEMREEEDKKAKERPKVHLAISPRKPLIRRERVSRESPLSPPTTTDQVLH
ncbi:hypothetical protein PFISCL1PPCAC_10257, partial [Pristionchus fissidentatus]